MQPDAVQQASPATQISAWFRSIPLCTRSVLVLCSGIYACCLLTGYDDFYPFCLSAQDVVQKLQVYRIFTSPLLHVGILHIAFNMLAFVPIASSLERTQGSLPLAHLLALLTLVGDSFFIILSYALSYWDEQRWLNTCAVGFSGIVFGLIVIDNAASGASHRSVFGFFAVPAKVYPWALLLLWQILLPGVSFLGHLGGILAGEAHVRGLLKYITPSTAFVQRMEGTWPVSACAHWDAFILSTTTELSGPVLPTSYRPSETGSTDTPRAAMAGVWSWVEQMRSRISTGYSAVPSSDPGERTTSHSPAGRGAFAGQPHTIGQEAASQKFRLVIWQQSVFEIRDVSGKRTSRNLLRATLMQFVETQSRMQAGPRLCHFCIARVVPRASWPRQIATKASGSDALCDWVVSQGGGLRSLKIESGEGNRGFELVAAEDIAEGTTVISLPEAATLAYDDGKTDHKLQALINQIPADLWGARLALRVISERIKATNSKWNTYIENLPRGIPGLPIFFQREAVQGLQYAPVTHQINKRCRFLLDYTTKELQGNADAFQGQNVDANALAWGMGVVTSRGFRLKGLSASASMLPLIDMSSHSFEPNCKVQQLSNGDVRMITLREVSRGLPLTLSYGNLDNDALLLDYGFFVRGNPHDRVGLQFTLALIKAGRAEVAKISDADQSSLDSLPSWQRGRLEELGVESGSEVTLGRKPVATEALVAAIRILAATDESQLQGRGAADLGSLEKPLNGDVEVLALRILAGVCLCAHNRFSSTLAEDDMAIEAALQGREPLAADVLLAVQFRAEKKRVLYDALASIASRIKEVAPTLTSETPKHSV
ncbi:hypothetical protein WJX73_007583 [Symbiochloris irregularis]|uniref:SET domain-containing protein n=1 Tax=Symbiochloris irregularis TaxID=706552 RepID=A0AAW1NQH3_9CHLO